MRPRPRGDEQKRPRVLIGLGEVAGYYRGLKAGFDELGVEATYLDLSAHRFDYGGADQGLLVGWIRACAGKGARSSGVARVWWEVLRHVLRAVLFLEVLPKHDVFVFGFFSTFFFFLDLPVLKLFGKKVVYQFHGSDSRPPYLNGAIMSGEGGPSIEECISLTRKRKIAMRVVERFADFIVNTPPQGHLHERPFVVWLQLGLPCRPPSASLGDGPPHRDTGGVRILHSPSRPEAKGSLEIRRSVENLRAKGHRIDFVEVTGQPNAVVLEELLRCDFVVDQLYADYGMPGFATEAAWFGKPVVLGGYARELWEELLPPEKVPPTHYCHPDDIEGAIEKLILDRNYRFDLGRRARAFVQDQWSPVRVAERYLSVVTGSFPEAWLYDPQQIRYLHGCGLPEDRARELVKNVVEWGGTPALRLADKPELERLFVRFARGEKF